LITRQEEKKKQDRNIMKFQTFFTVLWIGLLNVIVAISGDWPDATMSSEVLQRAEARAQRVTTAIQNIPMFARNPRFVYWYKHGRTETVRCADLQFVHIFKNAGTLLKDKMVHYCGAILCSHSPKHPNCTEDYRSAQLTNAFGVLRDPIDRFLSGYHEVHKRMQPLLRPRFHEPSCRLVYLRQYIRKYMMESIHAHKHLQPQYTSLLERPEGPVVKLKWLFLLEDVDQLKIPRTSRYDKSTTHLNWRSNSVAEEPTANSTYILPDFHLKRNELDSASLQTLCQYLYFDYRYVVANDYSLPPECQNVDQDSAVKFNDEPSEEQCWYIMFDSKTKQRTKSSYANTRVPVQMTVSPSDVSNNRHSSNGNSINNTQHRSPQSRLLPPQAICSSSDIPHFVDVTVAGDPLRNLAPFEQFTRRYADEWKRLERLQNDPTGGGKGHRLSFDLLNDFAIELSKYVQPPNHYPIKNQSPPPIEINCGDPSLKQILTGARRKTPATIIDFVPVGHELDVLEIRLFELLDVVDEHVLLEGTRTFRGHKKPLFYARSADRFRRFPITHVVADDLDLKPLLQSGDKDLWNIESSTRYFSLEKYVGAHGRFNQSDNNVLLMHGDCDEIPSRRALLHAKHCELRSTPVLFNLDFYIFSYSWLGNSRNQLAPALFAVKDLQTRSDGHLTFNRRLTYSPGRTVRFPPHSGAHLNRFVSTLVDKVYKGMNMAGGGKIDFRLLNDGLSSQLQYLITGMWNNKKATRVLFDQLSRSNRQYFVPWFANHNRARFPWMFLCPELVQSRYDCMTNKTNVCV